MSEAKDKYADNPNIVSPYLSFVPPRGLVDPTFEYVPAAATDVMRTWKKFGWVPPSEQKAKAEESA